MLGHRTEDLVGEPSLHSRVKESGQYKDDITYSRLALRERLIVVLGQHKRRHQFPSRWERERDHKGFPRRCASCFLIERQKPPDRKRKGCCEGDRMYEVRSE